MIELIRCPADDRPPLDNRGRRRGLPDRGRDLRDAREPRAVHGSAVGRARLGSRDVRVRDRDPEPAVGHRPAVRRRDRRPLWQRPRAGRRRHALRGRRRADGLEHERRRADAERWRAARPRPLRRLVPGRHRRLLPARAARPALVGDRAGDRGGLARPVPVRAARPGVPVGVRGGHRARAAVGLRGARAAARDRAHRPRRRRRATSPRSPPSPRSAARSRTPAT